MAGYWTGGENGEWIEDTPVAAPATPSWLPTVSPTGQNAPVYSGGEDGTWSSGSSGYLGLGTESTGGATYDQATNRWMLPINETNFNYSGGQNGEYTPGPVQNYYGFDHIENTDGIGAARYNNTLYDIYDTAGTKTGQDTWKNLPTHNDMYDWGPFAMVAAPFAAAIAGAGAGAAGAAGGAGGGGVGGMVNGAFLGEGVASGVGAWDAAYLGAGGAFTGGAGAANGGLDFSQGFTDGGTAGGALDTSYAAGSIGGTGGSISPGGGEIGTMDPLPTYDPPVSTLPDPITIPPGIPDIPGGVGPGGGGDGGGLKISDILGLLGGAWNMNNQNNASDEMLAYLKERQGINDNMYKEGSPEFNALWDEMSRKDAAAGRNSQYGPRSVDLAARIAQIKMDANTKMTTGIGNLYRDSINQGANSPASLLAQLGSMQQGGSFDWLDDFDLSDVTDLFGGLFD